MRLENASSRISTKGSDKDMVLWLGSTSWNLVNKLVTVQDKQVSLQFKAFGVEYDVFIAPESVPGTYTMAALVSVAIQQAWSDEIVAQYQAAKEARVSHLTGKARKLAKIELAQEYGLPTLQYYASMG